MPLAAARRPALGAAAAAAAALAIAGLSAPKAVDGAQVSWPALLGDSAFADARATGSRWALAAEGAEREAVEEATAAGRFLWKDEPLPPFDAAVSFAAEGQRHFLRRHRHRRGPGDKGGQEEASSEEAATGLYFRPVSCTLYCVMVLTFESLAVFTGHSVVRSLGEVSGQAKSSTTAEALLCATRSAVYSPMLCLLFVGCRMYVLATTKNIGEPPLWVKASMVIAVLGMTFQFLVVLLLPAASGQEQRRAGKLSDLSGEPSDVHPMLWAHNYASDGTRSLMYGTQAFSMFCIYGGVFGVLVGIATFPMGHTRISAAVVCTCLLSVLYFGICLSVWLIRTCAELRMPPDRTLLAWKRGALAASECTRKAPMFAVIFLAARMRALTLDPPYGIPPLWAQMCFYSVTAALFAEAAAAWASAASGGEEIMVPPPSPRPSSPAAAVGAGLPSPMSSRRLRTAQPWVSEALRRIFELTTYAMLVPIGSSLFDMKTSAGESAPLVPTTKAVLKLSAMFFLVRLLRALVCIIMRFARYPMPKARATIDAALVGISVAPQLAVLFVAVRMRALQITNQQGAPPGWAQMAMYISVFACGIQLLCCALLPLFTGTAAKVDEEGLPQYDLRPMVRAYAVSVVNYTALAALHGGCAVVAISAFLMTPEMALAGKIESKLVLEHRGLLKMVSIVLLISLGAMIFSSAKVVGLAVKFAIESVDKLVIGTDITVGKAAVDMCKGAVSVADVVVHNPEAQPGQPWTSQYLLRIDRILFDLNTWKAITSLGGVVEVNAVVLEGLDVCYELPKIGKSSNINMIVEHLDSLSGKEAPPPADTKSQGGAAQASRSFSRSFSSSSKTGDAEATPKRESSMVTTKEEKAPAPKPETASGPEVIVQEVSICDIGAGAYIAGMHVRLELDDIKYEDFSATFMHNKKGVVGDVVKVIVMTILKTILANRKIMAEGMKAAGKRMMSGLHLTGKSSGDGGGQGSSVAKVEEEPCPLLN